MSQFKPVNEQVVYFLDQVVKQPLPSEVFESLKYNIEEENVDVLYAFIKEEISSRSFEENQELDSSEYGIIINALSFRRDHAVTKNYERVLDKLIEKVEIVSENYIEY